MPKLCFVLVRRDFPVYKPDCAVRHFADCGVDLVLDTDRWIRLAKLVSVGGNGLGKGY
jgi:hypothetical protein